MKPTRLDLDQLLREMLEDEALDLAAVAESLRNWAPRFDIRAASRWAEGFDRPNRGGRPKAESFLDDAEPTFGPGLVDAFTGLVRRYRRSVKKTRNPAVFRDRLPSGETLISGWLSGGPGFPEAFRLRFAEVTMEPGAPRLAAARLALWSLGEDDSTEAAERLLERLKKQGKTRPK